MCPGMVPQSAGRAAISHHVRPLPDQHQLAGLPGLWRHPNEVLPFNASPGLKGKVSAFVFLGVAAGSGREGASYPEVSLPFFLSYVRIFRSRSRQCNGRCHHTKEGV